MLIGFDDVQISLNDSDSVECESCSLNLTRLKTNRKSIILDVKPLENLKPENKHSAKPKLKQRAGIVDGNF